MEDVGDDDKNHGMGVVVEYAGYKERAQWVAPKRFSWNYASCGQAHAPVQAPDEVFDMMFAKDNAAVEGFNK
jgi:hypothetical protein